MVKAGTSFPPTKCDEREPQKGTIYKVGGRIQGNRKGCVGFLVGHLRRASHRFSTSNKGGGNTRAWDELCLWNLSFGGVVRPQPPQGLARINTSVSLSVLSSASGGSHCPRQRTRRSLVALDHVASLLSLLGYWAGWKRWRLDL
jgi:hypothetical protein